MTGAGGSAAINFIKCLRMVKNEKFFLVGSDINRFHLELSDVDKRYILPKATDDSYIDALNMLIERENIHMVHPQPDIEVRVIAENRKRINAITRLPRTKTVKICQDKFLTSEILSKNNISVPKSVLVKNESDLEKYFDSLKECSPTKKVWIRAVRGAGSRAALPISTVDQAKMWIDYWEREKGIGYGDFMLCEFLPGKEFAWQSIWDDGELIVSQARERLEYLFGNITPSGQTSTPSIAVTVHRDDINEIATKAVKAIDKHATGIFCIDIKEDAFGKPKITEINVGRFFTTSNFFAEAGCNMPYYHIKLAFGEEIPSTPKYNPIPEGIFWVRVVDGGHKLIRKPSAKNFNLWNLREIKNVVIDFDGVLVKLNLDWQKIKNSFNTLLEERGIPYKFGSIMDTLKVLKKYDQSIAELFDKKLTEAELNSLENSDVIYSDGKLLLETLLSKGYKVFIWSRNSKKAINKYLSMINVSVEVFGREDFNGEKDLDFITESAILITDHPKDIKIGRSRNAFTIGITRGYFKERELYWAGADLVFPDLESVVKFFDSNS